MLRAPGWEDGMAHLDLHARAARALTLCAAAACAPCTGQELVIPWPTAGFTHLGHGYDVHTAEFKNAQCVQVAKPAGTAAVPLSRRSYFLHDVRSSASLLEATSSKAGGNFRTEAARASTRHGFSERLASDEKTATIVAAIGMVGATDMAQTAEPPHLLSASIDESFRNVCGTHFVSQVTYGSELWLAFSKRVASKAEAERFYADVRGAAPAWSGGASNPFTRRLESGSSEIHVIGQQSDAPGPKPYSLREAVAAYRDFPEQAEKKANTLLAVTVRPYPATPFDASLNARLLTAAAEMLRRYEVLHARARLIADDPDRFDIDAASVGLFDKFRARLQARSASIRDDLKRCAGASARREEFHASCRQLYDYKKPALTAEHEMPADFGAACSQPRLVRFEPILVEPEDFKPRVRDTKLTPGSARFDVDLVNILNPYPRRSVVNGKLRLHPAPGRARDDHVATLRGLVMNHDAPGCAIESKAWVDRRAKHSDVRLAERSGSAANQPDLAPANDPAGLLERVECWIDSPRNQARGAARSSSPRCRIEFKPLVSVALVPAALIEASGTTRARRVFTMPAWLD
jgi:hypothetical protein